MMDETIKIGVWGVDDNEDDLSAIEEALTKMGVVDFELFMMSEEVAQRLTDEMRIIILDERLIGKSGLQLLKMIKKLNPSIYVIAFNAEENRKVIIEYIRNDVDDWVDKLNPHYKEILIDAIDKAFRIARDRVEVYNWLKSEKAKIERK